MMSHRDRVVMLRESGRYDVEVLRAFISEVRHRGLDLDRARVLDLGCGANAPMTLMLHAMGVEVIGIDQYIGYRWGLGLKLQRYRDYRNEVGLLKTLRKALGEIVYDRHYYRAVEAALDLRLTEEGLDLRECRIEALPFEAASFDVIHSSAAWEHVADVRTANAQIARVLSPGGIAYIEIHLFPSLSGGHDLDWIVPGQAVIEVTYPWRHLRDPEWRAPVYLNRLRERDYSSAFRETPELEVLSWETEHTEGESLLNDDILAELRGYSAEELTKRSIIVVLRKRP